MIDWSSTFDIVFAAVAVALILFFLLSTIIVSAKGKRACNAFDVVLRLLASIALIASAFMLVCAVLTKLDGDYRIYVGIADGSGAREPALIARLYIGGKATDLPFPQLFDFLSTTVGSNIIAILFIDSLVALIVDCLVANKKSEKQAGKKADKKAAKNQPKKSPEQLKREAELERIRRLGEQAVRKTNEAARASSRDEKTDEPAAADTDTEQPAEDEQPTSDWRTTPQTEQPTSFVGIKDDADDFDTFDDFDADPQEQTDGAELNDETPETDDIAESDEYAPAEDEQPVYDEQTETDEFVADEQNVYDEQTETDEYETIEDGEQPLYDEQSEVDEYAGDEDGEQPLYDEQTESDEFDEIEQPVATEQDTDAAYEPVYDGSAEDNYLYEQPTEPQTAQDDFDEIVTEQQPTEQVNEQIEQPTESVEQSPIDDVEPDRDIYIPEMRTIVKQDAPEQAPQAQPAAKPRAECSASPKPRAARPATGRTVERTPDDKRLPVTRRYVILDRRNAVNMFGEYLKERNQAEKDKLKSSINTIIIE